MVPRKIWFWVIAPSVAVFATIAYRKYGLKYHELVKMDKNNFINYELRRDQYKSHIFGHKSEDEVFICAPQWVREGAEKLNALTENVTSMKIHGNPGITFFAKPIEVVELNKFSKLIRLQVLSRNENYNVDGKIKFELYAPGITDKKIIYSLKDLVRQTVIVGKDFSNAHGGYNAPKYSQAAPVYICDLSALQFQQEQNTGRLVLLREHCLPSGELDNFIYENVVGESKEHYKKALENTSRYVKCNSRAFGPVLFDTFAYKKFVAQDVIVAGLALNDLALKKSDFINFKYLKYGSGFFSEDFKNVIDDHILDGVMDGLETLFDTYKPKSIKNIELPFYTSNAVQKQRISAFEANNGVKIMLSNDDALRSNPRFPHLITATTNCGDPHAVLGNEMKYQSVDAAIAENLKDKGYPFSPLMNANGMGEIYFPIKSKY